MGLFGVAGRGHRLGAVPAPHVIKLAIGLTDAQNTWASIAQLAGFTGVVVAIGGVEGPCSAQGSRARGARR